MTALTKIEQRYVDQGYKLPAFITWEQVHAERERLNIYPFMVPVAQAPGCCAWAVPYIDGKPLKWRD